MPPTLLALEDILVVISFREEEVQVFAPRTEI